MLGYGTGMQRATWTDERLDGFAASMDAGFERARQDTRDLRTEVGKSLGSVRGEIGTVRGEMGTMRAEMEAMRGEIGALRGEVREQVADLRGEIGGVRTEMREDISSLRLLIMRLGAGTIIALAGVIATVGVAG